MIFNPKKSLGFLSGSVGIEDEKLLLIDQVRERRWKMVGHTLRHPEEPQSTTLESLIEGNRPPRGLRST